MTVQRLIGIALTGHCPEPLKASERKIMQKYQRLHRLPVTGQPDQRTLEHMRQRLTGLNPQYRLFTRDA